MKEITVDFNNEENEDFLSMPIKTTFTYEDVVAPWKEVEKLGFLLGASIIANIICIAVCILKYFL